MQVLPRCAPCLLGLPSEQFSKQFVRVGKIRKAGTVLVGMACGRLGRIILVESLAGPFGTRSVDLSAIKL